MDTGCKKFGQWAQLSKFIYGLPDALEKAVTMATTRNALLVVKEIKRRIRAKEYAPNSALTVALKGSSTPLIDNADLFRSIEAHLVSEFQSFVGVLRGTKNSDGDDLVNIARILHDGIAIKMTPAMQRWIFAQLRVGSDGGKRRTQFSPRSGGGNSPDVRFPYKGGKLKGYVVIPGRPFIKSVFEDESLIGKLRNNWSKAVTTVLFAS